MRVPLRLDLVVGVSLRWSWDLDWVFCIDLTYEWNVEGMVEASMVQFSAKVDNLGFLGCCC